jgi:hypothetical protein
LILRYFFRFDVTISRSIVSKPHREQYIPQNFQSPIITYEFDWLHDTSDDIFKLQSFENCMICNFSLKNDNPNSSPHDLMITIYFGRIAGIIPLVRTLRTTGCKATLVVLVDNFALRSLTKNHLKQIENCGVNFVNLKNFRIGYLDSTRWIPITDYIMKHRQMIDRIIMMDGFDVVFQGDPFSTRFGKDHLYFTTENIKVTEHTNHDLVRNLPFLDKEINESVGAINAGVILGETNLFLQFIDLFFEYFDKSRFNDYKYNDQTFLQWALGKNLFKNHSIPYIIDGPNGTTACMLWRRFFKKDHNLEFCYHVLSGENDEYALIVHQYDRFPTVKGWLVKAYPQNGFDVRNFFRAANNWEN